MHTKTITDGERRLIHKEQHLCNTCVHAPVCGLAHKVMEYQGYLPTISACGAYTHQDDVELRGDSR